MRGQLSLSVALVTRNRPDSLRRCLLSLRLQSSQPHEILISDDSDERHASQTEHVAKELGARYLRGPRRGLYANRNFAALNCTGTHVRTMDDDHEFPSEHWSICERAIAKDPTCVWVIGEYPSTWHPATNPPHLVPGELAPGGFSIHPKDPDNCHAIADGASIYPRQIFEKVRFTECFKFGASYLEFGARLKWHGFRMRALTDTYVIHHYDAATRSYLDIGEAVRSQLFAGFFLTFVYRPSLGNVLRYSKRVLSEFVCDPIVGAEALWAILPYLPAHYRAICGERKCLKREELRREN